MACLVHGLGFDPAKPGSKQRLTSCSFATLAEALRFVMETVPDTARRSITLQDGANPMIGMIRIRRLYGSLAG